MAGPAQHSTARVAIGIWGAILSEQTPNLL